MSSNPVTIRPLELSDISKLSKWLSSSYIGEVMGYFPQSEYHQVEWFKKATLDTTKFIFAICDGTENYIGNVALGNINYIDRNADLSIFIADENDRRNGSGTIAVELILEFGFLRLNLNKIKVRTTEIYEGSISFWQKLGFVREGIMRQEKYQFGEYHDKVILSLLRSEFVNRNQG